MPSDKFGKIRANFLGWFEEVTGGRQVTITRKDLTNLLIREGIIEPEKSANGVYLSTGNRVRGPMGLWIHWPSFVTANDALRPERGVFAFPWDDLDDWSKQEAIRQDEIAEATAKRTADKASREAAIAVARSSVIPTNPVVT